MDVRMLVGALDDFGGHLTVLIEDENGVRRHATLSEDPESVSGVPVVVLYSTGEPVVHSDDLGESDTDED